MTSDDPKASDVWALVERAAAQCPEWVKPYVDAAAEATVKRLLEREKNERKVAPAPKPIDLNAVRAKLTELADRLEGIVQSVNECEYETSDVIAELRTLENELAKEES